MNFSGDKRGVKVELCLHQILQVLHTVSIYYLGERVLLSCSLAGIESSFEF